MRNPAGPPLDLAWRRTGARVLQGMKTALLQRGGHKAAFLPGAQMATVPSEWLRAQLSVLQLSMRGGRIFLADMGTLRRTCASIVLLKLAIQPLRHACASMALLSPLCARASFYVRRYLDATLACGGSRGEAGPERPPNLPSHYRPGSCSTRL